MALCTTRFTRMPGIATTARGSGSVMATDAQWYRYLEHGYLMFCQNCDCVLEEGDESVYCEGCAEDFEEDDCNG